MRLTGTGDDEFALHVDLIACEIVCFPDYVLRDIVEEANTVQSVIRGHLMDREVLQFEGVLRYQNLLRDALGYLAFACGLGRHKAEHLFLALLYISVLDLNLALQLLSRGQRHRICVDKGNEFGRITQLRLLGVRAGLALIEHLGQLLPFADIGLFRLLLD